MEDETKDIGADETTLLDGAADDATTLLDGAADDATTLLDSTADDATTLLDGAVDGATTLLGDAADDATTLLGASATAAVASDAIVPDETGLFTETDILEANPSEDEAVEEYLPNDEFPEETDDEYDRRMMVMAFLGAIVFVLAIIAGLALSGAGSRLFHLFFLPAPIDEAPATLLAPEEPTQPAANTRPSTTPSGPVNAGANAADVSDVTPRNHSTSSDETQIEEHIDEEELEPEPEPEPIEEPVEEKVWVDEQGHYEDIYETQLVEVGQEWVVDVPSEPIYEVVDGEEVVTGYTEEQGHYDPIYEEQQVVVGQEWVIDVPGHWG